MKRVFIIHGWGGSPEADWLPWLKSELVKKNYQVVAPEMPDADTPIIERWVNYLSEAAGTVDSETYFIGHSIGCQTILRYLETINTPIGGAVFVSGWFNLENLDDEEKTVAVPWITDPIDVDKIKSVLPKSTLIISDNDPYGAFEENKYCFEELGSKIVVMSGAGHITGEEGYSQLPEVLNELEAFNI